MQSHTNHLYRFDPFLLLTTERLLMREGKLVPLPPKVLDTLVLLVENSGRILSKDELMQTLWPDASVEESNLTQNISQIRKALGAGEWVETIPKRGYRFAAPVQIEANPAPLPANGTAATLNVFPNTPQTNGRQAPGAAVDGVVSTGSAAAASGAVTAFRWPAMAAPAPRRLRKSAPLWLAGLGIFGLVLFWMNGRSDTQARRLVQQFRPARLTTAGQARQSALSHDGKYVAYVEGPSDAQSLLVRQVNTTSQISLLPPSETKFLGVTFAPDDTFVYYVAQMPGQAAGALYQIPLLGGAPKHILSGVDSPVALAPDGQAAAFVRRYPARAETALVIARLDRTEERQLLARRRPELIVTQGPAWSADGKLLACAAGNGMPGESAFQILVINLASGAAQPLGQPLGQQSWSAVGQLAWLGDGSGLVFNAWRNSSGVYGDPLWLLSYPAGEAGQLTNDLSGYQGSSLSASGAALVTRQLTRLSRLWLLPAHGDTLEIERATQIQAGFGDNFSESFGLDWTPDGGLVFASQASGNLDLWLSTSAGKQQQLTRDKHTDLQPAVSADGRALAFVSDRGGSHAIWRMDLDGNNAQQLTRGRGDAAPSFTPDGKWIVYSTFRQAWPAVWKVPVEGGEAVALTDKITFNPVVSPDGKWVACFYLDETSYKTKLAVFPLEGGAPSVLEPAVAPDPNSLGWMPDSRALCYSVTRQGVANLWRCPLAGGAPVQLTRFTTDQIFRFAWSRDGRQLACERGQAVSDVVLFSHN
jgi:Tol biopolymer transport system component/DNA-binding winged helix-turn-helix (wHTH) protein